MGNPHTKVEISFKTQIIEPVPIYFAYTQLMMWDILIASPYFYDLNYDPLFFYRFSINKDKTQYLDFIPIEHESNGRGSDTERSWDRVALMYHFSQKVAATDGPMFNASIKAWLPFGKGINNKNILEYRGVWQLEMGLSNFMGKHFDFNDLSLRLYPGGKSYTNPTRGGQELTYRLQAKSFKFLPLFILQLFHGYGESLQDYSRSIWAVRAGLGF